MDSDGGAAPNPVAAQDISVVIGLLAVLEGYLLSGEPDDDLVGPTRQRFLQAGLLADSDGERDLRQAINDLNQRLRYALGEYAEPIASLPVVAFQP